ncbi:MAG: tetratricopeptide repeat-containing diguanylate cyclase, partial [Erysipelotrichaceae bacterium]
MKRTTQLHLLRVQIAQGILLQESQIETTLETLYRTSNYQSISSLQELLSLAKKSSQASNIGWCHFLLGWAYHLHAHYQEALEQHNYAHNIFVNQQSIDGLVFSYNALLVDYTVLGAYDLAVEHGNSGIDFAQKYRKNERLVSMLQNTAIAYMYDGHYQQALETLMKAASIPVVENPYAKCYFDLSLAEAYMYNQQYESAKNQIHLVTHTEFYLHDDAILYETYHLLGRIALYEEHYELSISYLGRAIQKAKKINNDHLQATSSLYYALAMAHLHLLSEAEAMLSTALELAHQLNLLPFLAQSYEIAMEVYQLVENYQQGLQAAQQAMHYRNKLHHTNSNMWARKIHEGIEIQHADLYKRLYHNMELITQIGQRLTKHAPKEASLLSIYHEVNQILPIDAFSIALFHEPDTLAYEIMVVDGIRQEVPAPITVLDHTSLAALSFLHRRDILIHDFDNEIRQFLHEYTSTEETLFHSMMITPLIVDEECIGIISVQSRALSRYNEKDFMTFRLLSSYVAIALQNAKLFQDVEYLASHDFLTNIYNRREIFHFAQNHLHNNNGDMAILLLDVDNFKIVNDTYGHILGDHVLHHIAQTLQQQLRGYDALGRFGGEEFMIVLTDVKRNNLPLICERIRFAVLNTPFIQDGQTIPVSISIGVQYVQDNNL